jgi:hypothetical protein
MTTTAPPRDDGDEATTRISAYTSCPEKTVFTERANPDGWIATDLAVEVER